MLVNTERYGAAVHAYVLMTNHVHLLVTPEAERSLPQLLQGMGRDYVQCINRQYGRTGTLWQGRYKASLVEDEAYLLHCQRYIELNPVRAGMVADPGHYRYSSYRCNALGKDDPLVTPHIIYSNLGNGRERLKSYRELFETELDRDLIDDIRNTTNACRVLGGEKFKDQIEAMLERRVRPKPMGRPRKPTP